MLTPKFKSRKQEHLVRTSIAFILAMVMVIKPNGIPLVDHLSDSTVLQGTIEVLLVIFIGVLAFAPLVTPAKTVN